VERDDPPGALRWPRSPSHPLRKRAVFVRTRQPPCSTVSAPRCCRRNRGARRTVGRGESTIVNLVPRFFEPQSGRITVDGIDITGVRLADLRDAIAIVPQETQLFNGSIAENIRYGRLNATLEEVREAAAEANADEFVAAFAGRVRDDRRRARDPALGRQRQRIAIARAILRDPRILILDEATSALDSHSEALIEDALDRVLVGRTTLIIATACRPSAARRRFCTSKPAGPEVGTHETLLAAGGPYATLHAAQFARS